MATDQLPSEIISMYDEVDMTQEELNEKNLEKYDKDQVLNAITSKKSKIAFDLYFDDCLEKMSADEKKNFISQCLSKLVDTYALGYIDDYVKRNNIIETNLDLVINLINYICRDEWLFSLINKIEKIPLDVIFNSESLRDFIEARMPYIRSGISQSEQINELVKDFIVNSPTEDSLSFLFKLINKDLVGVVSIQLQQ